MEERIDEAEVTLAPLAAKITELFVYEPFEFQTLGPKIPEMIDMEALGKFAKLIKITKNIVFVYKGWTVKCRLCKVWT